MPWIVHESDGKRRRLAVVRTAAGAWVGWPGGARFFAPERTAAEKGKVHHDELRAPMTARVVKVLARAGDRVEAGRTVIILEAMKMEYQLQAPYAAVVDEIHCVEGELVDLGKTLAKLTEIGAAAPGPAGPVGPAPGTGGA
jgi:acetyl/propionyl-CoA carboxylase alpha subunit